LAAASLCLCFYHASSSFCFRGSFFFFAGFTVCHAETVHNAQCVVTCGPLYLPRAQICAVLTKLCSLHACCVAHRLNRSPEVRQTVSSRGCAQLYPRVVFNRLAMRARIACIMQVRTAPDELAKLQARKKGKTAKPISCTFLLATNPPQNRAHPIARCTHPSADTPQRTLRRLPPPWHHRLDSTIARKTLPAMGTSRVPPRGPSARQDPEHSDTAARRCSRRLEVELGAAPVAALRVVADLGVCLKPEPVGHGPVLLGLASKLQLDFQGLVGRLLRQKRKHRVAGSTRTTTEQGGRNVRGLSMGRQKAAYRRCKAIKQLLSRYRPHNMAPAWSSETGRGTPLAKGEIP